MIQNYCTVKSIVVEKLLVTSGGVTCEIDTTKLVTPPVEISVIAEKYKFRNVISHVIHKRHAHIIFLTYYSATIIRPNFLINTSYLYPVFFPVVVLYCSFFLLFLGCVLLFLFSSLGQVEGLKAQMCQALLANLDHDNSCSVFAAADNYQCDKLKEQAFSRIVQHFALAARSEGWSALTKSQLEEVT